MSIVILYLATAIPFLVLDALMLTFVMRPLFERHVSYLLREDVNLGAAAAFYLFYIGGLVWLVSLPALREGAPVILPAALIGAMAYGTYEFTSYAVTKGWHPSMVATDLVWGTALTALSAWIGVSVARWLAA